MGLDYLLIGTTTADIIPNGRVLGGTVSYSAPVLAAFGHNVKIVTSANLEDPLIQQLNSLADCYIVPSEYTPTFENRYAADGIRTQYVSHTAETITAQHIPEKWKNIEHVHIAPLVDDVDISVVKHFRNATQLLTPQGYLRNWDNGGRVEFKPWHDDELLSYIDILICSRADLIGEPTLAKYYAKHVSNFVLTDGESGGVYHNASFIGTKYDAYRVEEIDPTGAGDVFAAGVFGSLPLVGNDIQKAVQVGARLAAYNVGVQGVAQFTNEFINTILEQVNS